MLLQALFFGMFPALCWVARGIQKKLEQEHDHREIIVGAIFFTILSSLGLFIPTVFFGSFLIGMLYLLSLHYILWFFCVHFQDGIRFDPLIFLSSAAVVSILALMVWDIPQGKGFKALPVLTAVLNWQPGNPAQSASGTNWLNSLFTGVLNISASVIGSFIHERFKKNG